MATTHLSSATIALGATPSYLAFVARDEATIAALPLRTRKVGAHRLRPTGGPRAGARHDRRRRCVPGRRLRPATMELAEDRVPREVPVRLGIASGELSVSLADSAAALRMELNGPIEVALGDAAARPTPFRAGSAWAWWDGRRETAWLARSDTGRRTPPPTCACRGCSSVASSPTRTSRRHP